MSDTKEKTIRIIPFSGKEEDWRMWSRKFLARAKVQEYKEILTGTKKAPAAGTTIDESTDQGKTQKKLQIANEKAYNDLLLSCEEEVSFGAVDEAITTSFPDGDAHQAWTNLKARYESDTPATKILLKKEFSGSALEDANTDPDEWIADLERIRQRLKTLKSEITDEDLIIHILNNLPEEYENMVEAMEIELEDRSNPLKLKTVRERLRSKFQRLKKRNDIEDDKALIVRHQQFKGTCRNCGKYGHKAKDCRSREKNRGQQKNNNNNGNNRSQEDRGPRISGNCNYCGKEGHMERFCFKKKRDEKSDNEKANVAKDDDKEEEFVMVHSMDMHKDNKNHKINENTWLGDTGGTVHMRYSLEGMTDLSPTNIGITIGSGKKLSGTQQGTWHGTVLHSDGHTENITLKEVVYCPELSFNLFSLTKAMSNGGKLGSDGTTITMTKGKQTIRFDRRIQTTNGYLSGVEIAPRTEGEQVTVGLGEGKKINRNTLHKMLGHLSEDKMRATAKNMSWELTGKEMKCEDCALGKSRQKNLRKEIKPRSTSKGERLFIDIAPMKHVSLGGSRYWLIAIDDCTNFVWSYPLKRKSETSKKIRELIKTLKNTHELTTKYIRCDNAGENETLEKDCKDEGLGVTFEYTAPHTPQQNGRAEQMLATLFGSCHSMLNTAQFDESKRRLLWSECVSTATKLQNITMGETKTPHEHLFGQLPDYARNLRIFGEVGICKDNAKRKKAKLENKGKYAMFLGYADNHAGDVYRMLNLSTNKVITTRDVTWVHKMYGEHVGLKRSKYRETVLKLLANPEEEDGDESESTTETDGEDAKEPEEREPPDLGGKEERQLPREVRNLTTFFNPRPGEEAAEIALEAALLGATDSGYGEPTSFREAWDHPDVPTRNKWREAIRHEFNMMLKRGVWRYQRRNTIDPSRRLVGHKWVFKIKRSGIHRARLVALGYSQVPGVDFTANFAPVVSDITLRMVLMMKKRKGWCSKLIDVESAFLYGDLEEEIYMTLPQGLSEFLERDMSENCCRLQRGIYGLVQGARIFWKKFSSILTDKLGFERSKSNNCLFQRKNKVGEVLFCMYVDDAFCVGDKKAVESTFYELSQHFSIKDEGEMGEYVGCSIEENKDHVFLSQPGLIEKLEKKYGKKLQHLQEYKTPMGAGQVILRPMDKDELLDNKTQTEYRSGVGMLLYLLKHSRPDLSNSVRELTKVMDGATKGHLKSLHRVVKYVLTTKNWRLKMNTSNNCEKDWKIKAYSDSDYGGDRDTRRSVSGYIIMVNGCVVSWRSRGQKSVTLSSSEAEYVAASETVTEMLFIKNILEGMGETVILPMKLKVDNVGAIYMAKNQTPGQRTKHVDIRYNYVKELVEKKKLEVEFVRSENNLADVFTKNTREGLNNKLTESYMDKRGNDDENTK